MMPLRIAQRWLASKVGSAANASWPCNPDALFIQCSWTLLELSEHPGMAPSAGCSAHINIATHHVIHACNRRSCVIGGSHSCALNLISFPNIAEQNMAAEMALRRAQEPTIASLSDDLLAKCFASLGQKDR
jgi:hypothetical protein